eukprot:11186227-Lingulodinium_polyedra.AAC.1
MPRVFSACNTSGGTLPTAILPRIVSNSPAMASPLAWLCQCSTRPPTNPCAERRAGEAKPVRAPTPAAT